MKKFSLPVLGVFTLVFTACNGLSDLGMPETISVKQKASYELSLGGSSCKISEKFDSSKLQNTLDDEKEESTLTVYDYNPTESDEDVQQYILNYQIEGIQLGLTADSDISAIEFGTSFEAPDFSSEISSNLALTGLSFTAVEPGTTSTLPETSFTFDITSPAFDTMLIRSGTLDVVAATNTPSDSYMMLAQVTLTDASYNVIAGPSEPKNIAAGGTLSIDLAGKTLVPNMKILVTADLTGGNAGTSHTFTVQAAPNNIKFDTIKGLTMTASELGEKATINIVEYFDLAGINKALNSATINDGSLSFSCLYPDGWSGIVVEEEKFLLHGGVEVADSEFEEKTDDPAYILYEESSLSGKKLSPTKVYTYNTEDATEKSYIKFRLEDATIVFADTTTGSKDTITIKGSCDIKEIGNLVVDVSELGQLSGGEDKEIDTGISFGSLLSKLLDNEDEEVSKLMDNIEFSDISGCLLMTYPTICSASLSGISFAGSVSASYDGAATPLELLSGTNMTMARTDTVLSSYLQKEEKKNSDGTVKTDKNGDVVYKEWIGKSGAEFIENTKAADLSHITDLFNARPDNLKIAYSLALSGSPSEVILTGDDVKALTESTSAISISIVMVLPLKVAFVDNFDYPSASRLDDGFITIENVMKLADKETDKDLLKRDNADEDNKINKYSDIIQSVGLVYSIENSTGLALTAYFEDDKVFNGSDFAPKELKIGESNATLEFTKEEIKKIFSSESYPFTPRVKLAIKAPGSSDPIKITRDSDFGISAKVFVNTDGSAEIWNKND